MSGVPWERTTRQDDQYHFFKSHVAVVELPHIVLLWSLSYLATILCVRELWSGSNNRVYTYHAFHWLAKNKSVSPHHFEAETFFWPIVFGVPQPSGLVHWICVLMAESSECGFELRPWCLCPWARQFTIIASLNPGVNGYLWGQSWLLISPACAEMAAIELYTPQGAEMVSGMIYVPDEQG